MAIIAEEQLVRTVRQYNPWWRDKNAAAAENKPQKRLAYYETLKIIKRESLRRFAVLSGARRVGKTTVMYQIIAALIAEGIDPKNILYVSFDNPIIKLFDPETIIALYESLYPVNGVKYVFFDEIQYAADWELWLKVIYDRRRDIRLTATGSASPLLERKATDSGAGRWRVVKIPTLSFYEYCRLLNLEEPALPADLKLTNLARKSGAELGDLVAKFAPLESHFHRYLAVGGFPELALAKDDRYAEKTLREDVVDKVLKRDALTLFNIRSPLLMEKLFLYLCVNSTNIFSATAAAKELENVSVATLENYLEALQASNLIYLAPPINVGSKGALKGKPKIFIADTAIRNAALTLDETSLDEKELGVAVETTVYKHLVSFYQGTAARLGYFRKAKDNQKEVDAVVELPREKILCEVKYRGDSHIRASDAIVELCNDEEANVTSAFLVTKRLDDFGISKHRTKIPILRLPALVFLYVLGKLEANGRNDDM